MVNQLVTWHQALTLTGHLAVLGLQRGNDDGAGVGVVAVVQDGHFGVVAVVVVVVGGGSGLHRVGAVVAGAVGVGRIVDRDAADDILPLLG